jgi:hypothetical protein
MYFIIEFLVRGVCAKEGLGSSTYAIMDDEKVLDEVSLHIS